MQHGLNVSASKMSVPNYTSWNKHGPIPGHVQHSRQPSNNPYLSGRQLLIWEALYIPVDGNNDFSDVWKFVWRKSCPIKTEQFNWISLPNRTPNSPPDKNNWKIMENHFPKVLEEAEFCYCSFDLGNFPDLSPMNLRCRRYPSSLDAALPYDSSLCGITTRQFLGRCYSYGKGNWRTNVQPECFLWKYLGLIIYDTDFFCLIILHVKYPNVFCCFWSKGSSFICVFSPFSLHRVTKVQHGFLPLSNMCLTWWPHQRPRRSWNKNKLIEISMAFARIPW